MPDGAIIKTAVPCDCAGTCGAAIVIDFEQWGDEPREVWVEFGTTYHAPVRERLGKAWALLRGKDPWTHGVCLHAESIDKVVAALRGRDDG